MSLPGPFCRHCGVSIRRVHAGLDGHAPECRLVQSPPTPLETPAVPWDHEATPQETDENPPTRDEKGRFLVGNKGSKGRPKGSLGFARRIRDAMWAEHKGFLKATENPKTGERVGFDIVEGSFLEKVVRVANDPSHENFTWACEYLTARGYGKAPEKVMISGPKNGPIEVQHSGTTSGDSDRFAQILSVLERAGALPIGPGGPHAASDPEDERLHEAGADAAASGVSPVAEP